MNGRTLVLIVIALIALAALGLLFYQNRGPQTTTILSPTPSGQTVTKPISPTTTPSTTEAISPTTTLSPTNISPPRVQTTPSPTANQ